MIVKLFKRGTVFAAALTVALVVGDGARAAGGGVHIPSHDWSFTGLFGTWDRAAIQRGFKVYREICSACHSLKYFRFRNLEDLGYTEKQIKAVAAEYEVEDGPNDEGEMFFRPAKPFDGIPAPYPNDEAAKMANGGSLPPDLSVIVKARGGFEDYVYHLMLGFEDEVPHEIMKHDFEGGFPEGKYFNHYFPGYAISMPPQLYEEMVEYTDGTPMTPEQYAHDVTNFLTWVAEPSMEDRKRMGIKVLLFLVVFTLLFYALKRRVWSDVH